MITRRVWIRRAFVIGTAGVGAEQLWRHGHDYVLPSQFVTVEPGNIYRGAWQKPWPMRRIVNNYKIKTVLALAHPADHYLSVQERQLTTELGVKWIHIPIVDYRGTNDQAAEDAISDLLDQAAAVLADPANYPIFFHCHHGVNRTSMVQIAYRTKYCGWSLPQAAGEIERSIGLVKVNHGPDYRHMVSYYENRVLPLREQRFSRNTEKNPDLAARLDEPDSATSKQ
jgi:protein tyrosine/serine phosphatase